MVTFVVRYLTCNNSSDVSHVADHIDYIAYGTCPSWKSNCNPAGAFPGIGVEFIGIGSDFDGISDVPSGIEDVSKFPNLVAELLGRNYTIDSISKILGVNLLRVLRGAEEKSLEMQSHNPLETWLNTPATCRTGD